MLYSCTHMGTVGVKGLTLQHKTSAYTQKDPTNYAVFGILLCVLLCDIYSLHRNSTYVLHASEIYKNILGRTSGKAAWHDELN